MIAQCEKPAMSSKLSAAHFTSAVYNGRSRSDVGLSCGETNMPQGSQRLEY